MSSMFIAARRARRMPLCRFNLLPLVLKQIVSWRPRRSASPGPPVGPRPRMQWQSHSGGVTHSKGMMVPSQNCSAGRISRLGTWVKYPTGMARSHAVAPRPAELRKRAFSLCALTSCWPPPTLSRMQVRSRRNRPSASSRDRSFCVSRCAVCSISTDSAPHTALMLASALERRSGWAMSVAQSAHAC